MKGFNNLLLGGAITLAGCGAANQPSETDPVVPKRALIVANDPQYPDFKECREKIKNPMEEGFLIGVQSEKVYAAHKRVLEQLIQISGVEDGDSLQYPSEDQMAEHVTLLFGTHGAPYECMERQTKIHGPESYLTALGLICDQAELNFAKGYLANPDSPPRVPYSLGSDVVTQKIRYNCTRSTQPSFEQEFGMGHQNGFHVAEGYEPITRFFSEKGVDDKTARAMVAICNTTSEPILRCLNATDNSGCFVRPEVWNIYSGVGRGQPPYTEYQAKAEFTYAGLLLQCLKSNVKK